MTLTKFKKAFAFLLTAAVLLSASVLCANAASASKSVSTAQYTNPETSYQAIIIDDIDLLTESEEAMPF